MPNQKPPKHRLIAASLAFLVAAAAVVSPTTAPACDFCEKMSMTYCEEIASNDVAVIAKLVKRTPPAAGDDSAFNPGRSTFEVLEVLKGAETLKEKKTFDALYFGDAKVGTTFLVMGIKPGPEWATPLTISDAARKYITGALKLPKEGSERLAYFQEFLQDKDKQIQTDAYQEFAKAPFSAIKEFKKGIKHDTIVQWIKDPAIAANHRRLYLMMLSACNQPEDSAMLEAMLKSPEQRKAALDALVASYLTLKGPSGMELVEDLFLKNKDAEFSDVNSTIMALRFHGQQEDSVPRKRLLVALRYMLDRPKWADQVISDFARWEDWTVMDRLVELFKMPEEDSMFLRPYVIQYLRVCPLPEAKERLAELAKLDPKTVKQVEIFYPLPAETKPAVKEEQKPKSATDSAQATSSQSKAK